MMMMIMRIRDFSSKVGIEAAIPELVCYQIFDKRFLIGRDLDGESLFNFFHFSPRVSFLIMPFFYYCYVSSTFRTQLMTRLV